MPTVIEEKAEAREETLEAQGVVAAAPARRASAAERAAGAVTSQVIASPESLPFDRISRQRLLVAQAAADTLERLVETGAWQHLEPFLVRHLLSQARRLSTYVAALAKARPVRASEPALLLLRRLERRLEIAADLVEGEEEKLARSTAGGLYLGDFTEQPADAPDAGARPARKAAKAEKAAKAKAGTRRWATKAERLAQLRESKRVMTYVAVGIVAVVVSVGYNVVTSVQERHVVQAPPKLAFTPNTYLKDIQIFLPATFTAQMGMDMTVVVSKEWLLKPADQRVKDAEGASVFLLNRNVRKVRFQWDDGTPIVKFDHGVASWNDRAF